MGWRGTLKSIKAAEHRAERNRARVASTANRLLDKLDRGAAQLLEKARRLEAQIQKDIIKALNLRYRGRGFSSDPFQMDAGIFHGSISLTSDTTRNSDRFDPPAYAVDTARVEALDMLITQWATVVALKVDNNAPEYRLKLNWIKKTSRADSKIVLVDEENGQYYYPVGTDLGGEVAPGVPKTGLVAFEPFRQPTTKLQLRLAGARLTAEKFEPELVFRYRSSTLESDISGALAKPTLEAQIKQAVEQEVVRGQQTVQKELNKAKGCLVLFAPALPFIFWFVTRSFC